MKPNTKTTTVEELLIKNYIYDPETGNVSNKIRPDKYLKNSHDGYRYIAVKWDGKAKNIYHHRLAFLFMNGKFPYEVDHINGNKEDNTWSNLREVSKSQNQRNKTASKNSTSKFKGVHWSSKMKKWIAQIKKDKKIYYLGCFNVEEDAAKAYDKKAIEIFGDYARLNYERPL